MVSGFRQECMGVCASSRIVRLLMMERVITMVYKGISHFSVEKQMKCAMVFIS